MWRGILATVGGLVAAAVVIIDFPEGRPLDLSDARRLGCEKQGGHGSLDRPAASRRLIYSSWQGMPRGVSRGGRRAPSSVERSGPPWVTGGVLMLAGIANLFMIPTRSGWR